MAMQATTTRTKARMRSSTRRTGSANDRMNANVLDVTNSGGNEQTNQAEIYETNT